MSMEPPKMLRSTSKWCKIIFFVGEIPLPKPEGGISTMKVDVVPRVKSGKNQQPLAIVVGGCMKNTMIQSTSITLKLGKPYLGLTQNLG